MTVNIFITAAIVGGLLMLALYHSILFKFHKHAILPAYLVYLWLVFTYSCFKWLLTVSDYLRYQYFWIDEILIMVCFLAYMRFVAKAMEVNLTGDSLASRFVRYSVPVIVFSLIGFEYVLFQPDYKHLFIYFISFNRVVLLIGGAYVLFLLLKQRKKTYYRLLGAGAFSLILFGTVSVMTKYVIQIDFGLYPATILLLGMLVDTLFFSAAVGFKLNEESLAKHEVLENLLIKEKELAQVRIEKAALVYQAEERERLRIAADLHDDLGGTLSSILINAGLAQQSLISNPNYTEKTLEKLQKQCKRAIEDLKDIIWSMKFEAHSFNISSHVKDYGTELLSNQNITVEYDIPDWADEALTDIKVRKFVLLVIKEALNNVAKHGKASKALVSIQKNEAEMIVFVTDNGIGFLPDKIKKGFGLPSMKQRAVVVKGTLEILSGSGEGTTIKVSMPLK